ncbi:protein lin-10-like [Tachypleus tridentatus]|uniref:protein lin-10-like n=1 Tax=Tachypleus tridentatus TaxID=6853 RepID=UPI003FD44A2D
MDVFFGTFSIQITKKNSTPSFVTLLVADKNESEGMSWSFTSPSEQNGHLSSDPCDVHPDSVSQVIQEIKKAIHHSKNVHLKSSPTDKLDSGQPVWVPRLPQGGRSPHYGKRFSDSTREGGNEEEECDTDQETDRLLGSQRSEDKEYSNEKIQNSSGKKKGSSKEVLIHEPAVLIEGVLFRARYLGSTQLVCEGQPTKATRMMQAEEAVSRIKAPEGETQPNTEVDLFISTEKIMVLNTDLKEIMMDHALRTISYIADIGDLVVLMARQRMMNGTDDSTDSKIKRTPKMICHVFESEEAQFIAQSIGQAFQVAYMEFLKANGIEDSSFVKEMDYQEVLNSQEIFGNELEMFAKKEKQKELEKTNLDKATKITCVGVIEFSDMCWGLLLPLESRINVIACLIFSDKVHSMMLHVYPDREHVFSTLNFKEKCSITVLLIIRELQCLIDEVIE